MSATHPILLKNYCATFNIRGVVLYARQYQRPFIDP